MKKIGLVAVLLFVPGAFAGQYHVCTDANGKKTFSSMPCPQGVESETRQYQAAPAGSEVRRITTDSESYRAMRDGNRRSELKRDIKKSERKLDKLQMGMDRELRALRNKKRWANNNRAGAEWESSISAEMQAVTEKYRNKLDVERDNLSRLRSELAGLN